MDYIQGNISNRVTMDALKNRDIVDEVMLEFGSHTCADVSLDTVRILYIPEEITMTYQLFCDLWLRWRRTPQMVEKYGPTTREEVPQPEYILDWYRREFVPVVENFISIGEGVTGPYYLCACRESGDEYFVRRALPNDPFTSGKFMTVECRFSKMDDCEPRNKLAQTRGDVPGEYLLMVIHKPGTMEDQEKLKILLDQYTREGKFALV